MNEILILGDSFVILPMEQTFIWVLFYSTLFWLPVRGVAALFDHMTGRRHIGELDEEAQAEPAYHLGMKILPPL